MIRAVPLILLLLALGLAACGDDAPSSSRLSGELRYVKSGGFAGDHVVLVIQPDGSGTLKSRRGGERPIDLRPEDLDALVSELRGFDVGPEWGTSPKPAPDAFVHTVEYDGRKQTTDDAADHGRIALVELLGRIVEAHR